MNNYETELREQIKSELLSLAYSSAKKGPEWSQDGIGLPALDTLESIMEIIKAELGAARLDELNHILFTDDAQQFSKWLTTRQAELRNHFGIGEDI